ncbi:DNA-binding response regulator [Clavibacter michiganensis subsp. insidiosus]|nr:DNA-binding response regulator [Clavibacter michiganensis subsp. insidiosus]AWG00001.1 DNA-binding response regulator [Clavibacter michiganensis subsp. insidiosus]
MSVVVVDDEALVRSGIAMVLGASPRIAVRAAVSSDTAVATVREHAPDVVLLDIRMPAPDGLAILAELMAEPRPPAVAMLTTFDTDDQVLEALHRGASGFLLKDTDPEQLARHVLTLASGGIVLAPGLRPGRKADVDAGGRATAADRVRAVLVDLLVAGIAAALSAGFLSAAQASGEVVAGIVARLGLLLRRRWPWLSVLAALPAFYEGVAYVPLVIALFDLGLSRAPRWQVAVAAGGSVVAYMAPLWPPEDVPFLVEPLVDATIYTVGPALLGAFLRERRTAAARLRELREAQTLGQRQAAEVALARSARSWCGRCTTSSRTRSASSRCRPARCRSARPTSDPGRSRARSAGSAP